MEKEGFYAKIPKKKAELPAVIVLVIVMLIGFAFHYDFFGWKGGFIWAGIALPLLMWLYQWRSGEYFVKVDEDGIAWREHFFSNYTFIPWKYVQRIDYLVYEINFMLKETAQVVCFATSGLTDEEAEEMKQRISDIIQQRLEKENNGI